jgi:hypothetical protein
MATYTFTGEQTMVFPNLALTLNPGDSFDAPADFVAENVTAGKNKKVASIIEPEIDLTPVEPTPVETAPETAPATIEEAPAPATEGTN